MWNQLDWTTVSTGVGVVLAVGVWGEKRWTAIKKADPQLVKELPKAVVRAADGVGSFFVNVAKMPMFAGLAAKGELQAHHIEQHLMDTHLALAAAKAVGVFNSALNVTVDKLSATQRTDIIEFVRSELKKVGVDKTDAEIVQALKAAQAEFENIEKTVVPVVQQHDAAVQAWSATDTKPADAQPVA
ncbi:hypothetical protein [Alicyclobacillus ferrooxydans]|uniref:Uncharacterized protein n=1 Tax=Alicyclobacillus ferrooxydans TaxID=471514 RepID=A0A0P9CRH0_9BACL|nr:hypothetical protein [Alicyclobacillus ferrooxydans]KPV42035.1 hypothetical protein AN477_19900 [Alicyclobacillus ferrooxydans]